MKAAGWMRSEANRDDATDLTSYIFNSSRLKDVFEATGFDFAHSPSLRSGC
jgi:hypothetical protein